MLPFAALAMRAANSDGSEIFSFFETLLRMEITCKFVLSLNFLRTIAIQVRTVADKTMWMKITGYINTGRTGCVSYESLEVFGVNVGYTAQGKSKWC